ncbi:hypothetical protein SAMN05444338_104181 [Flavobacterium degerlachei]|jgi:hypothetical protein|uniref:Dolichyl-phosphate-mannose-protein mannosyltransferase n=1 Tax=Flavobacterium degerlachei TaxID=229203 RepID=A0A1H2VXU5_9FLAO|nr:hypothetical protein SAMN05444338_104181 [Flavobacterium degerlachei]
MQRVLSFIKKEKLFSLLFISILILSLRNLIIPLQGDETTYFKISKNLLTGRYYQTNHPSTVIPIVPFLMAFFSISKFPYLGFALQKLFHIMLTILGIRFCYLTMSKLNLDRAVVYSIILLTIISSGFISFLPSLYPESIIFVSFWGFIYYLNEPKTLSNFKKFFLLFILLVFTRYLYAILGLLVILYYFSFFTSSRKYFLKVLVISLLLTTPLLFWFKYVYNIESQNLSEISYFNRFKIGENPLWYNIKCGLGLEKHYEVSRINGIPAFISLFVPITGVRNFFISSVLLLAVFFGLYQKVKNAIVVNLLLAFSLVMLGFILAGTGFSRYWLLLLPIIYLGYYLIYAKFFPNPKYFIRIAQILSIVLVLNEIRLTFLILKKIL